MKMNGLRLSKFVSLVWALCILTVSPVDAQSGDKDKIIRQARQAYYNLKTEGLMEFHCEASPDWDSMLKIMKPPPKDPEQLLPLLKQLLFKVAVGPDGGAMVSHQSDAAPPSQQMAPRLAQVTSGIDQVLNGFFQAWAPFVFGTVFPEPHQEYELEDSGGQYRFHQKQGPADVVVTMTRQFAITEIAVKTPQLEATMHPQFFPGNKGYLLSKLDAAFKVGPATEMDLSINVDYQEVEGFTLPDVLTAMVTVPGGTALDVTIKLNFINYRVTKRVDSASTRTRL